MYECKIKGVRTVQCKVELSFPYYEEVDEDLMDLILKSRMEAVMKCPCVVSVPGYSMNDVCEMQVLQEKKRKRKE